MQFAAAYSGTIHVDNDLISARDYVWHIKNFDHSWACKDQRFHVCLLTKSLDGTESTLVVWSCSRPNRNCSVYQNIVSARCSNATKHSVHRRTASCIVEARRGNTVCLLKRFRTLAIEAHKLSVGEYSPTSSVSA